ncbi:MAG: hypothetical protein EA350_07110 [Gemmatimonadales bacterium]|nr:MAG: hypothetical protein EA350_07110 [Gemmatimonadales bacterium]
MLMGLVLFTPADVRAQDVSYSVIPTYQEIRWDDAFGFDRVRLYGVRASLDFGPYFSLQPFYAWEDGIGPRDGLTPDAGEPSIWDLQTGGVDAMVNLGRGPLVPFIKGGGGVIRIRPDGGERTDRIVLRYGGGLRFGLGGGGIGAEVTAENWTTRLSSPFVAGAVSDDAFPDDGLVDSWVYGAGVRIPLGTGYDDRLRGIVPGIAVEPFVVRTKFADEFGLERQDGVGVRAGVDFNQNVGLRASYWRGVDDDFSEFQDVSGYGAEARFALNTGPGLSPFLIAGAGRIRFTDDFLDIEGSRPDDLDHLTLGGGLAFGLGDFANFEIGARNLLMTPGADIEDITDPDDLVSNWQYSVGLALTVGASPRARDRDMDRYRDDEARRQAETRREIDRLLDENRRLRAGQDVPERRTVVGTDPGQRTMVIPVPEVGEVILRYGEAYAVETGVVRGMTAVDQERLEEAVAQAVARRAGDMRTLEQRLPNLVRDAVRQELRAMGIQPGVQPRPGVVDPVETEEMRWSFGSTEPYTGLQAHEDVQFLLGLRGEMESARLGPLQVVPEVAFGFGEGGTSLLLGVNGRYGWDLGGDRNYTPYGQLGVALTNQRLLSVNAGYGLQFDVGLHADGRRTRMFIEHQGLQLYRDHRFLVGVSIPR